MMTCREGLMPLCLRVGQHKRYNVNPNLPKASTSLSGELADDDFLVNTSSTLRLIIVPFSHASHYLIDIIPERVESADMVYDHFGTSLRSISLWSGEYSYIYASVDNYFVPQRGSAIAYINHVSSARQHFYFNAPSSLDNISYSVENLIDHHPDWSFSDVSPINRLDELPKEAISGEHHIHYTASEIYANLDATQRSRVKETLFTPVHFSTTATAGMMLWISQASEHTLATLRKTRLFHSTTYEQYTKIAKDISILAKSLQNLTPYDLREIFELEVLINRVSGGVDWEAERDHRVNPVLANINPDTVYTICKRLFQQPDSEASQPAAMSFEDFWASRWEWTAAGSFHSQYPEDEKYKMKEQELRNKFISAIIMPDYSLDHFLERKAEIHAWASVKYEWGKLRAIYGTDFTSYVLTHFLFYNVENTLGAAFPVGNKARPSYVAAKVHGLLDRGLHACLDFEDFNSQHSLENMRAVIKAWFDVFKNRLHPDQHAVFDWVSESISNTYVHDNMGLNTTYKSKGTLMSGWRLTTFINSVLNYVYTTMLNVGVKDNVCSLHNGDDVIMSYYDSSTLQNQMRNANRFGIRVQATKSSYGAIAEFLRVDHYRGEHGQYLSRNIATLMHGRIESKKAVTALDAVSATELRLSEFLMRGGKIKTAVKLRHCAYKNLSKVYNSNVNDLYTAKSTHAVCGGISKRPDASVDHIIDKEELPSQIELPPVLPGVSAYAGKILKTLKLKNIPFSTMEKRIKSATLGAVKMVRARLTVEPNQDKRQYTVYRGIYKAYGELNRDANLGKAAMTGFTIEVIGQRRKYRQLSTMVHGSKDPMKYLSVVL
uniref:RNA-directed RNA polymerase n=1 Tax=Uromyces fabae virus TaxID=3069272 RepID=A0AA51YE30_9VIRU|nr:hypothetical protein [Uromyces fabae virus]